MADLLHNELYQATNVVDVLRARARHQPDQLAYTFLADGETEAETPTYQDLDRVARAIATMLQQSGAEGERALLLYPPGFDFLCAFLGCLYAKVIAVAAYPPRNIRHMPRVRTIIDDCQPKFALTTTPLCDKLHDWINQSAAGHCPAVCTTDDIDLSLAAGWDAVACDEQTLALLQYTSGSTSSPRGVMVNHRNILHNSACVRAAHALSSQSVSVSWLPTFHDMGLIDGMLQPLVTGFPGYLMAPSAFIQKPVRWLQAISTYRATHSGAPNFAYELCVSSVTPEQMRELDLSCWYGAYCGAEPIRTETLEQFAQKFAACGFQSKYLYPCYGLAEHTLLVSGGPLYEDPVVQWVDASALEQNRVIAADGAAPDVRSFVSSGQALLDTKIVSVDPDSHYVCPEDQVGEIWLSSPSVAQGYWEKPEETAHTFHAYINDTDNDTSDGPYLRTGDLGFMKNGHLFVTGRIKDLIIIRGRNHYPQDIETTVKMAHPALQQGTGAAFAVEVNDTEQLVVLQEVARTAMKTLDADKVLAIIQQAVVEQHDVDAYDIVLVPALALPKTTSGKIQRSACRQAYLDSQFKIVGQYRQAPPTPRAEDSSLTPPSGVTPNGRSVTRSQVEIQTWLVHKLATSKSLQAQDVDIHQPFSSYGIDSITGVRIAGELQEWLQVSLSPTLMYDYPTIASLSRCLAGQSERQEELVGFRISHQAEPIAIVGIGCRLPGANNPEEFWHALRCGVDAIGEVPASRWDAHQYYDPKPATRGKMNTMWGGFLEHIDGFDAQFFGISPLEAERMDPQQRLLLEVSWEALEHAGIAPTRLEGSNTGVFIGISSYEYIKGQFADPDQIDRYTVSGNALSIAANRLSYVLDLHGPSLAIDTACSSSLSAVHLACEHLKQGQCDVALAGGVNLILQPDVTIALSQARMLAAGPHCKTFDASADGYVRGEGCGIVVLKRLSQALNDGDSIVALIQATAMNQDGRSNGLTAPNGLSQQAVLRRALDVAGVAPAQVSYMEAHGTGTALGDPIEVNSIQSVLGAQRAPEQACWIGSVKTNIGHLESAAGVAGLIKVALSLQHNEIAPHLHLNTVNPYLTLAGTPFQIPTECTPWPDMPGTRFAGINSFGFGGTNVSAILASASALPPRAESEVRDQPQLVTLSAKSDAALRAVAHAQHQYMTSPAVGSLPDISHTLNTGRSHLAQRLACVVTSCEELRAQLAAVSAAQLPPQVSRGVVQSGQRPKVAFVFTGQGSQYAGMGSQLYHTQQVFREAIDRCHDILLPEMDIPLRDLLFPEQQGQHALVDAGMLDETAYTQPALFALAYALTELWKSWGVIPDVVMGHSVGEYVAACVAGAFSLEDGLKLIAARGRLMQALPQEGLMAVVFAGVEQVSAVLQPYASAVSIAAVNGPRHVVVSGQQTAVEAVVQQLHTQGVKTRALNVSHAFHSPLMVPMLEAFARFAAALSMQPLQIDLISNVTGKRVGDALTPQYWCQHVRQPVQFAAGMQTLQQYGCDAVVEIGPAPVLLGMGRQCLPDHTGAWLPSVRKAQPELWQMYTSLAELYVRGVAVDWEGFHQDGPRHKLRLPTYPFQRERFWFEAVRTQPIGDRTPASVHTAGHPLLGRQVSSAVLKSNEQLFETQVKLDSSAVPSYHRIFQIALLPATTYLEIGVAAGLAQLQANQHGQARDQMSHQVRQIVLEEVSLHTPLVFAEEETKTIQTVCRQEDQKEDQQEDQTRCSVQIFSLQSAQADSQQASLSSPSSLSSLRWIPHSQAHVTIHTGAEDAAGQISAASLASLKATIANGAAGEAADAYYTHSQHIGIDYTFKALTQVWQRDGQVLAQMRLPQLSIAQPPSGVFEASLQILVTLMPPPPQDTTWFLQRVERLTWHVPVNNLNDLAQNNLAHLWCYGKLRPIVSDGNNTPDSDPVRHAIRLVDVQLFADEHVLAVIEGVQLQAVNASGLRHLSVQHSPQDWFYHVAWQPKDRISPLDDMLSPHYWSERIVTDSESLTPQAQTYGQALSDIEALCVEYILQALAQLGWPLRLGQVFRTDELAQHVGVAEQYQRLLRRLLDILVEDGILSRHAEPNGQAEKWTVVADRRARLVPHELQTLHARYPDAPAELQLLERCGSRLAEVLKGNCDPLELLFPQGDFSLTTQLYQDSWLARSINGLARQTLLAMLNPLPPERPIRILEIGAGTGGLTSYLLPALPAEHTRYVFTDLSPLFLSRAKETFKDFPCVEYCQFDVERSPAQQDIGVHEFDVVVAANVLHATRDLRQTLQHIRQVLAPGGMLLLVESTAAQRWLDLSFGLTQGWWRFSDTDLRPAHPLLSAAQWQTLLQAAGFAEPVAFSPQAVGMQQAVLVAQSRALALAPAAVSAVNSRPAHVPQGAARWLIFADIHGVAKQLAQRATAAGAACIMVYPGTRFEQPQTGEYRIHPAQAADFQQLLQSLGRTAAQPLNTVVYLWGLDAPAAQALTPADLQASPVSACWNGASLLHLVQTLVADSLHMTPAVWLITRAAQPVYSGQSGQQTHDALTGIAQTPLWGFGKVLSLEHPNLWGGMLDLAPMAAEQDQDSDGDRIFEEIISSDSEDHIAFRNGQRFVARLMKGPQPETLPTALRSDATYLITGGLGTMGGAVAQHLVQHGARHLVLLGRRPPTPEMQTRIQEFSNNGLDTKLDVLVVQADVADEKALERVLAQVQASMPPLRGVVHAAGIGDYHSIIESDLATRESVFRAKVVGTWLLHKKTQALELDFFVCFSSMTSLWGAQKQSLYVAANHFLDGFAHYRHALGLPALSINWGPVAGGGLVPAEHLSALAQMGIGALQPTDIGRTFAQLLSSDSPQVAVVPIDWDVFKRLYEARQSRRFLELIQTQTGEAGSQAEPVQHATPELLQALAQATPQTRRDVLATYIQTNMAELLGLQDDKVQTFDPYVGFFDLGMDSLSILALKDRLELGLGCALPTTILLECAHMAGLIDYIGTDILDWEESQAPVSAADEIPPRIPSELAELTKFAELAEMTNAAEAEVPEEALDALIMQELENLEAVIKGGQHNG